MRKPTDKQKAFMNFDELKLDNTYKFLTVRSPKREANVFKLECLVGVDEAPNGDVTALSIAFVNSKKEIYVIQTIDDTTEIGKKMIKEITEMRGKK